MKKNFWENFIFVTIVLVIFQLFFEEFVRYKQTEIFYRNILIFTGFLFDLIFTIEFIVRSYLALKSKKLYFYWFYQRGWVDFLSSIPLLIFNSIPNLFVYIFYANAIRSGSIRIFNILKIVKAIRIARILRLIRVMKILGKIHNAESKMAQRHTSVIATTVTFTIILVVIFHHIIFENQFDRILETRKGGYENLLFAIEEINQQLEVPIKSIAFNLFASDKYILRAYYEDILILSKVNDSDFKNFWSIDDYIKVSKNEFNLIINIADINRGIAYYNLQILFIIIFVVLSIVIIYSKHFVQNISDIVHIIYNGLTNKDYKLQVKIREEFKDDEIFKLAEYYNDVFLADKIKKEEEAKLKKDTPLTMDDILKFYKV